MQGTVQPDLNRRGLLKFLVALTASRTPMAWARKDRLNMLLHSSAESPAQGTGAGTAGPPIPQSVIANAAKAIEEGALNGPFRPSWESLRTHPNARWFDDAKFGIYCHWGAFSVPAFCSEKGFGDEWYSYHMYIKGTGVNAYHLQHYGPLNKFGFKDFIPTFKAERFDPDAWADLFKNAGARFAGPVTMFADGFAMWRSRLTRWNSVNMGPRRDVVGELSKAIRRHDMKFVTTFHHQWRWGWFPTLDKTTDTADPEYADLYGPPLPSSACLLRRDSKPLPDREFCEWWVSMMGEVIDRYRPDLIWIDARMNAIDEKYRRDVVAFYYNRAAEWGREVVLTYKDIDIPPGVAVLDLERGRLDNLVHYKWLTDDSIDWNSWGYTQNHNYKSVKRLIHELIDIVSKNGNLLLNVGPMADGTFPEPARKCLLGIGDWLRLNGEAIYGTRPWETYGEGPTKMKGGPFAEEKIQEFTAQDVRFTTKGNVLYAISLGRPDKELVINSLSTARKLWFGEIGEVRLLGVDAPLRWARENKGLTVQIPHTFSGSDACVFKITGKGR
jgi:alpha-L-fucosidase